MPTRLILVTDPVAEGQPLGTELPRWYVAWTYPDATDLETMYWTFEQAMLSLRQELAEAGVMGRPSDPIAGASCP